MKSPASCCGPAHASMIGMLLLCMLPNAFPAPVPMFKAIKDTLSGKTKEQSSEQIPLLQGHDAPPALHHSSPPSLLHPAQAVSRRHIHPVVREEDAAMREETKKVVHLAANANLDLIAAARPLITNGIVPRHFVMAIGDDRPSKELAKEQSEEYVRRLQGLRRLHKDKVDAHARTLEKHIAKLKEMGSVDDWVEQHEKHRNHLAILRSKASNTPDVMLSKFSGKMPLHETHKTDAEKMFLKEEGEVDEIMRAHGVANERHKGKEAASTSAGHAGAAS